MMVNKEEIEVVKKKETEDENERFIKCYHNQVRRTVQVSETDEDTNRSSVTWRRYHLSHSGGTSGRPLLP